MTVTPELVAQIIVAAVLLFSALRVVTSDNLVRSVLWLAVTLVTTAVVYVMLAAPFMAGIQILLYTGGVVTLMLFGVMLTNRDGGVKVVNESDSASHFRAGSTAATLFSLMTAAILLSEDQLPEGSNEGFEVTTATLGQAFLTDHLLAFEVLSVLLLAAMIGAIVLSRRKDFGAPTMPRFAAHTPEAAPAPEPAPAPAPEPDASADKEDA